MAKTAEKRNVGMEVLEGLRQLERGEVGRVINVPSVSAIRERTGLSQTKFASLLGVSVRTLQEWEQGRPGTIWRGAHAANGRGKESEGFARSGVTRAP